MSLWGLGDVTEVLFFLIIKVQSHAINASDLLKVSLKTFLKTKKEEKEEEEAAAAIWLGAVD